MDGETLSSFIKEYMEYPEKSQAVYHKFAKEFVKLQEKKKETEQMLLKFLKSVNANNLAAVKKSDLDAGLLKSISGYEDEEGVHLQNSEHLEHEFIETTGLNPLELACVRSSADVLTYFINDLNIRSRADFC